MVINYINWDVSPEIFSIGNFSIRWYSVLFGLAFILGYYIIGKIYKRENIAVEKLDKLFVYVFIGTFIGARLGHCLFYEPAYYLKHPLEMILPITGTIGEDLRFIGYQGLASHGAAIGILIALYLYQRKTGLAFLWVIDRLVIVVALGGCFIRLGNLMNSEIIGISTTVPWAFIFERLNDSHPRHPSQLYEALSYLIIFVVLYSMYLKKPDLRKGKIFGLFLIMMFFARFFIEFIKANQVSFESNMPVNMGQILSIPFILLGVYFLLRKPKFEKG